MRLLPEYAELADLCSKNPPSRYGAIGGVRVVLRDGKFTAEATDGRKWLRITTVAQDSDYPPDKPVVIEPRDWKRLCNLGKPRSTALSLSDGNVIGRSICGRVMTIPKGELVGGKFPDDSYFLTKEDPQASILADVHHLSDTLAAMAPLFKDDDRCRVRFHGHDKDGNPNPVHFSTTLPGGTLEALLIQLVERE